MAPMPMLLLDFGGKRGFRPAAMRAAFPRPALDPPATKSDPPAPASEPGLQAAPAEAEPPAAPAESELAAASTEAETQEEPPAPEPPAEAPANRIEMTIDSLPHHTLTEPIPLVIDQFGDKAFTASMLSLDIQHHRQQQHRRGAAAAEGADRVRLWGFEPADQFVHRPEDHAADASHLHRAAIGKAGMAVAADGRVMAGDD